MGYIVQLKDDRNSNVIVEVGDLRDISALATIIYGNSNDHITMIINTIKDEEDEPWT